MEAVVAQVSLRVLPADRAPCRVPLLLAGLSTQVMCALHQPAVPHLRLRRFVPAAAPAVGVAAVAVAAVAVAVTASAVAAAAEEVAATVDRVAVVEAVREDVANASALLISSVIPSRTLTHNY